MQANLINIHIPRGKPRLTVDKILPRGKRRRDRKAVEDDSEAILEVQQALGGDPKEIALARMRAQQTKIREKREREEAESFWNSPEGARVLEYLREPEE
jgi:hypothetical protein